ncbi:MAG: chemotaxis protein CheB [Proteobacteria bacterium]|nr:chemotaxis protein CheB [Pseudomonadota bacterium]
MGSKETPAPQANQAEKSFVLRKTPVLLPEAIAVASSAGGPQALFKLMPHFKDVMQPVFVTQHIPASFTSALAGNIRALARRECIEATEGMPVQAGKIYLAPGYFHMTLAQESSRKVIRLNQDAPENFCRPAADPMLRSLATVYAARLLVIVLTGMGSDGLKGCEAVVGAGGTVIAQDQASSVVLGMPGVVAGAGLCHAVLPLEDIGPYVVNLAKRGAAA